MFEDIGILMLILALCTFVVGVALLFIWRVPSIVDELSGRKAKRQIKRLKELNIGTGGFETNEIFNLVPNSSSVINESFSVFDTGEGVVKRGDPGLPLGEISKIEKDSEKDLCEEETGFLVGGSERALKSKEEVLQGKDDQTGILEVSSPALSTEEETGYLEGCTSGDCVETGLLIQSEDENLAGGVSDSSLLGVENIDPLCTEELETGLISNKLEGASGESSEEEFIDVTTEELVYPNNETGYLEDDALDTPTGFLEKDGISLVVVLEEQGSI